MIFGSKNEAHISSPENPWMCLIPDMWRGSPAEAEVLKDINKPSGEEWEFQARSKNIEYYQAHILEETYCLIHYLCTYAVCY